MVLLARKKRGCHLQISRPPHRQPPATARRLLLRIKGHAGNLAPSAPGTRGGALLGFQLPRWSVHGKGWRCMSRDAQAGAPGPRQRYEPLSRCDGGLRGECACDVRLGGATTSRSSIQRSNYDTQAAACYAAACRGGRALRHTTLHGTPPLNHAWHHAPPGTCTAAPMRTVRARTWRCPFSPRRATSGQPFQT